MSRCFWQFRIFRRMTDLALSSSRFSFLVQFEDAPLRPRTSLALRTCRSISVSSVVPVSGTMFPATTTYFPPLTDSTTPSSQKSTFACGCLACDCCVRRRNGSTLYSHSAPAQTDDDRPGRRQTTSSPWSPGRHFSFTRFPILDPAPGLERGSTAEKRKFSSLI